MQLRSTFRGLNRSEVAVATRTLERQASRMDRLADRTTTVRAVVDGGAPTHKVSLFMSVAGEEFNSQSTDYDLPAAITTAVERMRSQLVRHRNRRETQRHRRVAR